MEIFRNTLEMRLIIGTCKSLAANLRPSSFSTLCNAAIPLCKAAMLNKTHTFSKLRDESAKNFNYNK